MMTISFKTHIGSIQTTNNSTTVDFINVLINSIVYFMKKKPSTRRLLGSIVC